jgi:hypothetical protein
VGFETTISAEERPQIYALNRAAIGTGNYTVIICGNNNNNAVINNNYGWLQPSFALSNPIGHGKGFLRNL